MIEESGTGRPSRTCEPHDGTGYVHVSAVNIVGFAATGAVVPSEPLLQAVRKARTTRREVRIT
jgi:hypothetical protein